jgi:hypothetical protein
MTLHDVVWVFDSWDPTRDYPYQVGEIWCCGRHVVMRGGRIACEVCCAVVVEADGKWSICQIKGYVARA